MKVLIVFAVCLVASVYSRQVIIRRVVEDDTGSSDPIIIREDQSTGGSRPGTIVIREQQPGQGSGGNTRPQGNNILADLFHKAAQITSATAEGLGDLANGALQGTASFGQGLVKGAQQGVTTALQNTGDVGAKFSNGVENVVDNWWNAMAQK